MVIDICTFNQEDDLWDIHYNILKDHVDQFIVIAFDESFSGQKRTITFPDAQKYPKARFILHTKDIYQKYAELAANSKNTVGAEHWKREFMQKESIKDALIHLNDDDIVFVGDVDEIWMPKLATASINSGQLKEPRKLKLRVYAYWLNNKSSEEFWGTLVSKYKWIKDECLNHARTYAKKTITISGLHFTSMGGPENVKKKLTDSYTHESYATPTVLDNLAYNIDTMQDFLGRNFTYTLDESHWPQYLKDNRAKYAHLCK